jgi:hypothetical protein
VLSDSLQAMIQNNMKKNEKKNEKMGEIDNIFDKSSSKLIDDNVNKSVELNTQEESVPVTPKVVSQSEQLFIEISNFFEKNPDKVSNIKKK